MTLGCGGYGGNITSDNISPRHLLNIKRLAYEISPAANRFERGAGAGAGTSSSLPAAPPRPVEPVGVRADVLMQKIDQFLGARGFKSGSSEAIPQPSPKSVNESVAKPLEFVCEEDVRIAIKAGRKLVVSERAIVTPAARDLGDQHRVFSVAPWRG
jgi:hypothetical protein